MILSKWPCLTRPDADHSLDMSPPCDVRKRAFSPHTPTSPNCELAFGTKPAISMPMNIRFTPLLCATVLTTVLAAMFAAPRTGVAQSSPAQIITSQPDMVTARLLPGWRLKNGTYMAGLELRMAPGWKTYWRAPGDAGIPPTFSWSGSKNLRDVQIKWPTPRVFWQNSMRSIGYADIVVLPINVTPRRAGKPVTLKSKIDIGVCRDICVPVTLRLAGALATTQKPDPMIAAALATRPFSAKEAGVGRVICTLSPVKNGIHLRAQITLPSTGPKEAVVVETADPAIWSSEPKLSRTGNRLTADADLVHANGGAFALDRSKIRFTILGRNHAVDIVGCTAAS